VMSVRQTETGNGGTEKSGGGESGGRKDAHRKKNLARLRWPGSGSSLTRLSLLEGDLDHK
jgi:hypothetical protein